MKATRRKQRYDELWNGCGKPMILVYTGDVIGCGVAGELCDECVDKGNRALGLSPETARRQRWATP